MSHTFAVDNVGNSSEKKPIITTHLAFQALAGGGEFESQSSGSVNVIQARHGINPFVAAIHHAYNDHLPLAFGPDHVWLTILQGVSAHIETDPERNRKYFVEHDGRQIIRILRDHFVKGYPNNDWEDCFEEFSEKIGDFIGKKKDLLVPKFSTTGLMEKAAFNVSLMNAMQYYFNYRVRTRCGFPQITLEGSPDDWHSIKERVLALSELDLQWWVDELIPVLDQLIATSEGRPDRTFWHLLYKDSGGSGGPYSKGWINTLFPYLRGENPWNGKVESWKNDHLSTWSKGFQSQFGGGPQPGDYGNGLSSTPFLWEYMDLEFKMEIVTGFVGVEQDLNGVLRPVLGWGVREKMKFDLQNASNPMKCSFYRALAAIMGEDAEQIRKAYKEDPDSLDVSFTINGKDVGGKAFFEAWQMSYQYALEKAFRKWKNHRIGDFCLQMENCLTEFMDRLDLDPDHMKEEYGWDDLDLDLTAMELSE